MSTTVTTIREAAEGRARELAADLRLVCAGPVLTAEDAGYDAARTVWNAAIDKHPLLIARCSGTADVVAAVKLARKHDLLIAVRGGGHNVAGLGTCDGGLLIDLSLMRAVHVDPVGMSATVQGGATWADFDRETQLHGLSTPGGLISSTGVGGLTLGGGIGWLSRKFGLSCDNLEEVELVTAEGDVLRASADTNPDLFWAIRGGGGNFGVVTHFRFRLHRVGPEVCAGFVLYPATQSRDVLAWWRDFTAEAPDEVMSLLIQRLAPAVPFIPAELHGKPVIMAVALYAGDMESGADALRPIKKYGSPVVDTIGCTAYMQHQRMFDVGAPFGRQNYWKSEYLANLGDEAIDALVDACATITSPYSMVPIFLMGGATSRISRAETAFGQRHAPYNINLATQWLDPAESHQHVAWTRATYEALRPFSTGDVYVNFLGQEGQDRVRAAYGEDTYQRLVAVKRRYDPTNVFRINQNIQP